MIGWRSYKSMVDSAGQSCVSKIGEVMKDDSLVTLTGIGKSGGLPIWLEAKISQNDPACREMQFTRGQRFPKGIIAQNSAVLAALLEETIALMEEDHDRVAESLGRGPGGDFVGSRQLGAAIQLAKGLERTASQQYVFDEHFENEGFVRDDGGMRISTSVASAEAMREAARAGLGHLSQRPGIIFTADCGVNSAVVIDRYLNFIPPEDKRELIDAVSVGGFGGGVDEVVRQMEKLRLKVAITPSVVGRIKSSLPEVWDHWERESRHDMWLQFGNVADSSCASNWLSMAGVNWQLWPAHPLLKSSMKPGYSVSVEMLCSGATPGCQGRLAVVSGDSIGTLAGTQEESGPDRTVVWTSTPLKECVCGSSVTAAQFATAVNNNKILELVRQSNLQERLTRWKSHTEKLLASANWSADDPELLGGAVERTARALVFADEAVHQLEQVEVSLDRFDHSLDMMNTSDL